MFIHELVHAVLQTGSPPGRQDTPGPAPFCRIRRGPWVRPYVRIRTPNLAPDFVCSVALATSVLDRTSATELRADVA